MADVRTPLDMLFEQMQAHPGIRVDKAAKEIGAKTSDCLLWAKFLKEHVRIKYSINVLAKPGLFLKGKDERHTTVIEGEPIGAIIDSYPLTVDKVPCAIEVRSKPKDSMRTYYISTSQIGVGTRAYLRKLIRELAVNISTDTEDMADPKRADILKANFQKTAKDLISSRMPVTSEQADILSGLALHRIYGLDELDIILGDDDIEEICINSGGTPIVVYHRRHGWLKTNVHIPNEDDVFDYASRIGRRVGKDITNLNPLMDARLISGDRVMASMYPISMQGNTITIRKFARDPWTIVDFMSDEYHTISPEIAAFLWMGIHYELSIMVAGGTASGKTSILNSLAAFVPPGQRIISIEDTREIQLPSHLGLNWIQLTTREPNPDGLGGVNMLDLIISSLRMRPDRIIVGEIRDRAEAEVLFEAMHTGHSVYSTMHADTCQHVRRRITEPPISIPDAELEALEIIVTQYRDRLHGMRRTFEVAEIIPGTSERKLDLNYLYRWRVKSDTFDSVDRSNRVFNDINLYTGMTPKEIDADLIEKQRILEWMTDNKIRGVDEVGRVMNLYYTDKDDLLRAVDKV